MKLLLSLKRKLIKNNTIKKEYTEFIQKNFDRAHASYIPKEQLQKASYKVWYLSHFDVHQPKKPDQLRVVFGCSAVFDNHSLNKHLLQGPDLMNSLMGVSTRFRKEILIVHHQGRGMTLNAIRQSCFWIINGRSVVAHFVLKCVTCRKLRGTTHTQKMSNVPEERLTPTAPFTYTSMDVFGPWHIKVGRKTLKRYGLIFTCLYSRAVHLEMLNTMKTDSFINALRRFINRRGKVRELRSDQGTNLLLQRINSPPL